MDDVESVAVVGMAVRVPGASSIDELWEVVRSGSVAISRFAPADAAAEGRDGLGDWVGAEGLLDEVDLFDHRAHGMTKGEADLTDPQHRVLLDCAADALDVAGINPTAIDGPTGVFVGSAMSTYLLRNLLPATQVVEDVGALNLLMRNDKDFAASLLAYRLGLTGPVLTVGAACATSLVAVHLAVQSLLNEECDVAIAGGVSIQIPQQQGYLAVRDGVYSPTGVCRPFDEAADGTVGGSGAGVVILRRSSDVARSGDWSFGSIRGTAVNNGGSGRIGYAAPSVEAQEAGLNEALEMAGVSPETIGFVETHGTGTRLGDPMEFAALNRVLGAPTSTNCYLGGAKANFGHLDVAAGVVGLIKALAGLAAGTVPPLAGFSKPNPELPDGSLDLPVAECEWPTNGAPRRGVVSSLGAGGTNAFAVIEQADSWDDRRPDGEHGWWMLPIEAATDDALTETGLRILSAVEDRGWNRSEVLASLAARRPRAKKGAVLVPPSGSSLPGERSGSLVVASPMNGQQLAAPAIGLVFPGNCPQIAGSARELARSHPPFAQHLEQCLTLWEERGNTDVARILLEREPGDDPMEVELLQPALFTIQYCLGATLLDEIDLEVGAVLGHSLGEWVAGTIAGIIDLPTAVDLVSVRTESLSRSESGAMAAVSLPAEEVVRRLVDGAWLAADNGPEQCVVSGHRSAVEEVVRRVVASGNQASVLHGERPGHCPLMEKPAHLLAERLKGLRPSAPVLPLLSTRTGDWFADEDLAPWADQLWSPVCFRQALDKALVDRPLLMVEATGGSTVGGLLRRHPGASGAVSTAGSDGLGTVTFLRALAAVRVASGGPWTESEIDPGSSGPRYRIPLPPTARKPVRCWIEPSPSELDGAAVPSANAAPAGLTDIVPTDRATPDQWFSAPTWVGRPIAFLLPHPRRALVLSDGEIGERVTAELTGAGTSVRELAPTADNEAGGDSTLVPGDVDDWLRVLEHDQPPDVVVHTWCAEPTARSTSEELKRGVSTLVALAQALGRRWPAAEPVLLVVAAGSQRVLDEAVPAPERATMLGVTKVLPRESPGVRTRFIDLPADLVGDREVVEAARSVANECRAAGNESVVAYRGGRRWAADYAPTVRPTDTPSVVAESGVHLVVGGTGGIGMGLAEGIASPGSVLVLASRSASLYSGDTAARVAALEQAGVTIELRDLDITDGPAVRRLVQDITERHGSLGIVAHAVGVPDTGGVMQRRDLLELEEHLLHKVEGCKNLLDAIDGISVERLVLTSSIGTVLHSLKYGECGYVAANDYVLALAQQRQALHGDVKVIAWTDWVDAGMWVRLRPELARRYGEGQADAVAPVDVLLGLTNSEGSQVFVDALGSPEPSLVVSTIALESLLEAQNLILEQSHSRLVEEFALRPSSGLRPDSVDIGNPEDLVGYLAGTWQALLGGKVQPHDNFFELGGDSLIALRVLAQIERDVGVAYPMADFLTQADLASLAAEVEALASAASAQERFSF